MKRMFAVVAGVAVAALFAVPAVAGGSSAFDTIEGHYEAIRLALLKDGTDGVAAHAKAIIAEVAALEEEFDTNAAGVAGERAGECQSLLPSIGKAAGNLAGASDLAAARAAFGELSKPMVRYRETVSGQRPIVVYCPMAKKSWLQPQGTIGNPYLGQKMPTCGEIVSQQDTPPNGEGPRRLLP
jgi:hypothetical protein